VIIVVSYLLLKFSDFSLFSSKNQQKAFMSSEEKNFIFIFVFKKKKLFQKVDFFLSLYCKLNL